MGINLDQMVIILDQMGIKPWVLDQMDIGLNDFWTKWILDQMGLRPNNS